jgi:hypothetical protein
MQGNYPAVHSALAKPASTGQRYACQCGPWYMREGCFELCLTGRRRYPIAYRIAVRSHRIVLEVYGAEGHYRALINQLYEPIWALEDFWHDILHIFEKAQGPE